MNQPKSLRELVESAISRHETSGRQLSFMAQKHGFRITTTTINHLKAGTYKSVPSVETIRAIAWLAGVSEEVAFTAAGQPVPGPPFAEELPPGVDNLPPKARKAAIDMLRVLVELNRDADESKQAYEHEHRRRLLREAGFVSSRQKTEEPDDDIAAVKRRTAENIEIIKARQRRGVDHADNNIPLPGNYLGLAADTSNTRHVDGEREWAERGETSQETE